MNILWINNIAIPQIAEAMGDKAVPVGGWMVKLADEISVIEDIHLSIAFPYHTDIDGETRGVLYFGFVIDEKRILRGDMSKSEKRIEEIMNTVQPDVIHIFGTEGAHSYAVSEVCGKMGLSDRVAVSIQGMVSVYWKHYSAYLSHEVIARKTIRDVLKGNIADRAKHMRYMGTLEKRTISNARHVIGRTDWDKACTYWINPKTEYHFNNEMLRNTFYISQKWNIARCEKHSLFMSQATSPIKGLHLALQALTILKKEYPDVVLYVGGKDYYKKEKYKLSYYEKSILEYIKRNRLEGSVCFTGFLNERQMVEKYLKTHVFVSASSIENSPNSVCEAMMLGVPVVSSMVGGVNNLMEHGIEGFVYQADAPYMLAYYIKQIFDDDELAKSFSMKSQKKAESRHNVEEIVADLIHIYTEINEKRCTEAQCSPQSFI